MTERTVDETGREILVHENGMIQDATNGRTIRGPTETAITRNPREMLQRRNEKSRQVADEAIDEGTGLDPSKWGTGEGWRRLIVHTVQTYMKSSNIRGMAEVLSKLGIASGHLSTREE